MQKFIENICKRNSSFEDNISIGTIGLRKDINRVSNTKQKTRYLYKFLMQCFSFQGISDGVAIKYRNDHGDITFFQVNRKILKYYKSRNKCKKLYSFESFSKCGYQKNNNTCNNQRLIKSCPVPTHDLRKGSLNQTAYSLYFFIRDKCNNDLFEFIKYIIDKNIAEQQTADEIIAARNELLTEFTKIFGVGYKVASMTLSDLLLSDLRKPKLNKVGRSMVAVDRQIHHFLDRTGALDNFKATHNYGKKCDIVCSDIVIKLAEKIDAKKINKKYPSFYPRFIQHSIFHFCAKDGLAFCNKMAVGDSEKCAQTDCNYYDKCKRNRLGANK